MPAVRNSRAIIKSSKSSSPPLLPTTPCPLQSVENCIAGSRSKNLGKIYEIAFGSPGTIRARFRAHNRWCGSPRLRERRQWKQPGNSTPFVCAGNLSWLWICLLVWFIILERSNSLGKKTSERTQYPRCIFTLDYCHSIFIFDYCAFLNEKAAQYRVWRQWMSLLRALLSR